ncbi:MAG: hypothetical protein Q9160_007807 [Pyrenula sp. 1 TL-2023]
MGILSMVEDRPTPKAVYNWRVYLCAATAASAAVMIGYDSAFIGTTLALPSFTKEFEFAKLSKSQLALVQSNIVSVYQAGAFFGTFFAYASAHFLGRRLSLVIFALVFLVGAGMMLGASAARGLGLIYAGRVLAGIGVGGASMVTPIYIAEIAPPAIRGGLVGLYELSWQIGGLVGFWINYGVKQTLPESHSQWLIPFAVQLIPAGLLAAGAFLIKESPRWLFFRRQREKALHNLCWVRKLPPTSIYIVEEVSAIEASIEEQHSTVGLGFWQPFRSAIRSRRVLWRLFLGGMLFLAQNGSGINAVNYYSPTVFASLGITQSFLSTGIFGVVKTVLTLVWLLVLVDHLGRRPLLLIGATGGSLCMWYLGAYLKISPVSKTATNRTLTPAGTFAIFIFYLWTAFYTPSWNGTPWVINSEWFPPAHRPLGQLSAAANNWLWNFLISRFTPQMFLAMGYGVYFFFAALMALSVPFVWALVPETKGVPLEAMERLFEVSGPVGRANKVVMAELRGEEERFRSEEKELEGKKEMVREIECSAA